MTYLVHRYADAEAWTGGTPVARARVQRWLSVAAGEMAAGPCSARLVTVFGAPLDHEAAIAKAHALFAVMDQTLTETVYLAGDSITLADVAAYSYTAHAPEGGVSMESYPHIRKWLDRVEAQPRFVGMAKSAIPAAA
ncbi:MAG: glutathione binding-like protein [Pseudomonadota bacterium]